MKSVPGSTFRSRFSGVIFAHFCENNGPFCNQIKMLHFVSKTRIEFTIHLKSRTKCPLLWECAQNLKQKNEVTAF